MMKKALFCAATLLFIVGANNGFTAARYAVCGPDEDGCSRIEGRQYCACIPYNEQYGDTPYCLDFDNMTCAPLAQQPNCDKVLTYPNQASCLATIFQSEPVPPCKIKPASFCIENKIPMCDESGNPKSCHPG